MYVEINMADEISRKFCYLVREGRKAWIPTGGVLSKRTYGQDLQDSSIHSSFGPLRQVDSTFQ